jgi:hypothetical protein
VRENLILILVFNGPALQCTLCSARTCTSTGGMSSIDNTVSSFTGRKRCTQDINYSRAYLCLKGEDSQYAFLSLGLQSLVFQESCIGFPFPFPFCGEF